MAAMVYQNLSFIDLHFLYQSRLPLGGFSDIFLAAMLLQSQVRPLVDISKFVFFGRE